MYECYLGTMLCPIAPSKLQSKIKNQNKTITLINDGEINVLKQAGLTEISFDLLLPNVKYPFAIYKSGFQNAQYFLDILEDLKKSKKPFYFKVIRKFPNGNVLFDTDVKVSLEDYDVKEEVKQGFDVTVSVKLKHFRDYGTKICNVVTEETSETEEPETVIEVEETRPTENSPEPVTNETHIVKSSDTLWNLAKKYYGDGSKYPVIFEANKDKITNPNVIHDGQVLIIPAL